MRTSRFKDEQVLQILQEAQAGTAVKVLCAKHNISPATFHAWKRKFGGMDVSEARRLRALTEENARLKRLVADSLLQIQILQEVNPKRVHRVRAKASLRVRKRQRMARRLGPATPERRKATHPGHVCSCDLVHDQTGSKDVIAIIAEVMAQRGAPWENPLHREFPRQAPRRVPRP